MRRFIGWGCKPTRSPVMSRVTRFVASLSSAYVTLAASMLYISVGVPLALKFLPKEQYGLWALVLQTSVYLSLLDLGVLQTVARLLILQG